MNKIKKQLMYKLPKKCLRDRKDCQPLSQIVSTNENTFYCCGENDGNMREIPKDKYTLCFKGKLLDEMSCNDRRDLVHNAAVILGALAIIEDKLVNLLSESKEHLNDD